MPVRVCPLIPARHPRRYTLDERLLGCPPDPRQVSPSALTRRDSGPWKNNNNNNNKGWGTPGAYLTLAVFLQLGEPAPTTFVARISNIGVQNVVGAKKHIAGCRTLSSIGHEIMALWPHIWRGPV